MDFIAGALELAGKYVTGKKNKYGWLLSTAAGLFWIIYVLTQGHSYGLLVVTIPALFINIYNYRKWSKYDRKDSHV